MSRNVLLLVAAGLVAAWFLLRPRRAFAAGASTAPPVNPPGTYRPGPTPPPPSMQPLPVPTWVDTQIEAEHWVTRGPGAF